MKVDSWCLRNTNGLTSKIARISVLSSGLKQPSVMALIDALPSAEEKDYLCALYSSLAWLHPMVRTLKKLTAAMLTTSSPKDEGKNSGLAADWAETFVASRESETDLSVDDGGAISALDDRLIGSTPDTSLGVPEAGSISGEAIDI
jgi:hypothetical protein